MTETKTQTLTEFLAARIDEDEALAKIATGTRWVAGRGEVMYGNCAPQEQIVGPNGWYNPRQADVTHIAHHDPARVLAECKAKRWIVDFYRAIPDGMQEQYRAGLGRAVRCLALPYADHPDYRQEWKP